MFGKGVIILRLFSNSFLLCIALTIEDLAYPVRLIVSFRTSEFIYDITFIFHTSFVSSRLMSSSPVRPTYFYFNSTSNIKFGVPTKPVGMVYVKFQNSKSLQDPNISLSNAINSEGGTDTYLIVE